ncbi:major facilitator superfamily transporter [Fusarium mundagurra]|uniref:Major facilitator superfamily transporter n=1 Tax=Fusarium mundagurra TaxID=1567541 RepID=A0A8H6DJ89_9HYPO|nr:major facilitator superfamily transporter [Fusarium mundagurra]
MATPIVSMSEEDASWMQWDPNVETVWPEVAAPSSWPQPMPSSPAPIEEEPEVELSWQELQAMEDARYNRQRRPSKL